MVEDRGQIGPGRGRRRGRPPSPGAPTAAAHQRLDAGLGDGARGLAHLLGAARAVLAASGRSCTSRRPASRPAGAGSTASRAPPPRRRSARAVSIDSVSSASRPLIMTVRHILVAEARPTSVREDRRAPVKPSAAASRRELRRVRAAEQHRRGDARGRRSATSRGLDVAAAGRSMSARGRLLLAGRAGVQVEEPGAGAQRPAPRRAAADGSSPAVTALMTRSAPRAAASAASGRRDRQVGGGARGRAGRVGERDVPGDQVGGPRPRGPRRGSGRPRRGRSGRSRGHGRPRPATARRPRRASACARCAAAPSGRRRPRRRRPRRPSSTVKKPVGCSTSTLGCARSRP